MYAHVDEQLVAGVERLFVARTQLPLACEDIHLTLLDVVRLYVLHQLILLVKHLPAVVPQADEWVVQFLGLGLRHGGRVGTLAAEAVVVHLHDVSRVLNGEVGARVVHTRVLGRRGLVDGDLVGDGGDGAVAMVLVFDGGLASLHGVLPAPGHLAGNAGGRG